jgi:hypothetical protein
MSGIHVQKREGIQGLVENIISSNIELMPVYGLHRLNDTRRLNSEAYLIEGISATDINKKKPVVILNLSSSRPDFSPEYNKENVVRMNIADPTFSDTVAELKPGQILVAECGELPMNVFNQMYRIATMPSILEGANASNFAQLAGKSFMSPTTETTKFPFSDREGGQSQNSEVITKALDLLGSVERGLSGESNLTKVLSEELKDLSDKRDELTVGITWCKTIKDYWGTEGMLFDFIKPLGIKVSSEISQIPELSNKKIEIWTKEDFTKLEKHLLQSKEHISLEIKSRLSERDVGLYEEHINSIKTFLEDSRNDKSYVSRYFQIIKDSAQRMERNQVLLGVKLHKDKDLEKVTVNKLDMSSDIASKKIIREPN